MSLFTIIKKIILNHLYYMNYETSAETESDGLYIYRWRPPLLESTAFYSIKDSEYKIIVSKLFTVNYTYVTYVSYTFCDY